MQAQTITNSSGDDFAADLLTGSPARTFIAFEPAATQPNGTARDSTAMYSLYISTSVGKARAAHSRRPSPARRRPSSAMGSNSITPDALGVTASSSFCQYRSTTNGALKSLATAPNSPSTCMQMLLDFTFAQGFGGVPDFTFASRASTPLGDILDAQPADVGAPGSLVQDPSYEAFQANWANVPSPNNDTGTGSSSLPNGPRKQVLYVATNDGLLHAFWAGVGLSSLTNNELWAMLPPAVMPNIGSTYPSAHAALLDGSPGGQGRRLGPGRGANDGGVWRTTLVAGYGRRPRATTRSTSPTRSPRPR